MPPRPPADQSPGELSADLSADAALPETHGLERSLPVERPLRSHALFILWPAFLMAGVLETMVFAVLDPDAMRWFGAEPIEWSRSSVYSVTFLIFWGVIATAGALTQLLSAPGPATEGLHR